MSNINQLLFFRFLFLLFGQILIFNNFLIFGNNVNIYLIFVLVFPLNFNTSLSYLIVFLFGFILDFFSNSMGIITFSLLISILIKPYILKFVFGNFDINQVRKTSEYISKTSLFQKTSYLLIMFLSHQLIVNFIDIFSFEKLKIIINKTLVSTIISIFFSYIIVLIFFRKNER
jgi:hypothetical protein